MENNNENNTEIITENTIGTFLTLLLIWSRSFKIRSSLNAGFFDFDVAQGLRHPAHVAYPCVCACHLISICTLATAHLSQVCRGQGPVPRVSTDGVLTLAKPFRTLVCTLGPRARGRGPSVSAPVDIQRHPHIHTPLHTHTQTHTRLLHTLEGDMARQKVLGKSHLWGADHKSSSQHWS